MLDRVRSHATYANVMATIAVFIALGAGAYAAGVGKNDVKSKHIKDGAVKSKDIGDGAVKAADVGDGEVGSAEIGDGQVGSAEIGDAQVGSAEIADDQVGAAEVADELRLGCPDGTRYLEGACMELATRAPDSQVNAQLICSNQDRRLPDAFELMALREEPGIDLAAGGEWSGETDIDNNGTIEGLFVQEDVFTPEYDFRNTGSHRFRCVARPLGG